MSPSMSVYFRPRKKDVSPGRYIIIAHLMYEAYAVWTKSSASACTKRVYPDGGLSITAKLSLISIIFGGVMRGVCHRHLGKFFTWEQSIYKDHQLITSGPYSYVRHPAYSGLICVGIGY